MLRVCTLGFPFVIFLLLRQGHFTAQFTPPSLSSVCFPFVYVLMTRSAVRPFFSLSYSSSCFSFLDVLFVIVFPNFLRQLFSSPSSHRVFISSPPLIIIASPSSCPPPLLYLQNPSASAFDSLHRVRQAGSLHPTRLSLLPLLYYSYLPRQSSVSNIPAHSGPSPSVISPYALSLSLSRHRPRSYCRVYRFLRISVPSTQPPSRHLPLFYFL